MKAEIEFFQDLDGSIVISFGDLRQQLPSDCYQLAVLLASKKDAIFKDAFIDFYKSAIEQDDRNSIKLIENVKNIKTQL